MNYQDLWPLLQRDILGVLAADPFIGPRPGVLVEPGDLQSIIQTKTATAIGQGTDGKSGVGYLVLPVERAEDEDISNPFGPLKLSIVIQFVENVTINQGAAGTQIPIRIYAARAAKLLKLYTPVGFTQNLVAHNPVISEFTPDDTKSLRVGQIEFTAVEADNVPLVRLNRPQITVSGNAYPYAATVNVPPNTAALWYTTDNSHPAPNNPKAVFYNPSSSITIPGPCLLRCRAFGPDDDLNTIASDTAAHNFQ